MVNPDGSDYDIDDKIKQDNVTNNFDVKTQTNYVETIFVKATTSGGAEATKDMKFTICGTEQIEIPEESTIDQFFKINSGDTSGASWRNVLEDLSKFKSSDQNCPIQNKTLVQFDAKNDALGSEYVKIENNILYVATS